MGEQHYVSFLGKNGENYSMTFLKTSNRAAISYDQYTNPSMRNDGGTNVTNRSPIRGPLRGSHRANEE